ncbi:DUF3231 family protein [Halocella sp. SP3-1]|uniref:DUF3231 family protein n=1 Tax=Halocella sp. SP3-1 TaxID=2382161 RepID=UPI000F74DE76|nr:DUF3231 family protein [Halocella sp. SP3-1]AZO94449.1 DUF3231 family protein [Halocella sp. SP3-1]
MNSISIFNKKRIKNKQISTAEAHNIWNLINLNNLNINTGNIFKNFIHDPEFLVLENNTIEEYKKINKTLKNFAIKYKISLPSMPQEDIQFTTNIDVITDEVIFKNMVKNIVYFTHELVAAIKSSTTTDDLRKSLIDFVKNNLNRYQTMYKYGKLKGWVEIPPSYKTKPAKNESLSVAEATHIWDHLILRYDQLCLTNLHLEFTHDPDFRGVLQIGKKVLSQQISKLEELGLKFEVPLPKKPPLIQETPIDPELIRDEFTYRNLLSRIQSATDLHVRSIIDSTRNDDLRKVFLKFLEEELDIYNNFVKYGKIKTWAHIVPMYNEE